MLNALFGRASSPIQTLTTQGAVTVNDFLDRQLSTALKTAVDEMFATFSQCATFTDEAFTFHFRERHTIWVGGLPAELNAIGKNPDLYSGLFQSIHDATRRVFGSEWTPLPGISFIRSHRSSATHLTWHIDADAANALEVAGGGDCINVWLPLQAVGRTIPSYGYRSRLSRRDEKTAAVSKGRNPDPIT